MKNVRIVIFDAGVFPLNIEIGNFHRWIDFEPKKNGVSKVNLLEFWIV